MTRLGGGRARGDAAYGFRASVPAYPRDAWVRGINKG